MLAKAPVPLLFEAIFETMRPRATEHRRTKCFGSVLWATSTQDPQRPGYGDAHWRAANTVLCGGTECRGVELRPGPLGSPKFDTALPMALAFGRIPALHGRLRRPSLCLRALLLLARRSQPVTHPEIRRNPLGASL